MGPPGVGPGANTSEGVLANFFNSLLSKKTGQPGSPGTQVKSAAGNDDCKYIFYPELHLWVEFRQIHGFLCQKIYYYVALY